MPPYGLLCAAPHCGIRNRHIDSCDDAACTGCQPRPAADAGLLLCWVCTRRIAEDARKAAVLHTDLAFSLIHTRQPGERTSGSGERAPAVNDAVVEARSAIRVTLVDLAKLITGQRGFHLPDDGVHALAGLIATSAEWLAAHPDAGQHAHCLRDIASDGRTWRLAYPSSSDRLYIGECPLELVGVDGGSEVCGTRLHQTADEPLVHCPGCGTDETIEWWQRRIAGESAGWVDAYALAAHLSMRWKRPVDAGLIRKWSQRTAQTGVAPKSRTEVRNGQVTPVVERDDKGRALFDLRAVVAYAEKRWGSPA